MKKHELESLLKKGKAVLRMPVRARRLTWARDRRLRSSQETTITTTIETTMTGMVLTKIQIGVQITMITTTIRIANHRNHLRFLEPLRETQKLHYTITRHPL